MARVGDQNGRIARRGRGLFLRLAAWACIAAGTQALAQTPGRPDPEASIRALSAENPSERDAAVDTLLNLSVRPDVARRVGAFLVAKDTPPEVRARLLAGIAASWDPPGRLYRSLIELADRPDPPLVRAVLPALGAYRTREAAETLVKFAGGEQPPEVRDTALSVLVRATGRDDLGADPAAWAHWLEEHKVMSPAEWQDLLAQGLWRRGLRLDAERAAMGEKLTDGYRRLYLTLPGPPAEDRPRLVSQLLLGMQPDLRDLAFDLLSREVSAGNTVDPSITAAAQTLLESPDARVRARAAGLLLQLSPPGAGARFAKALSLETDPATADQLLAGVARWPEPAATPAVVGWLDRGPSRAALEAAGALIQAGAMPDAGDRERTLAAARRAGAQAPSPPAWRLLTLIGTGADRDRIIGLLGSANPSVRSAAAEMLADQPAATDAILEAARTDPLLFASAAEAVARVRPTAAGYLAVEGLTAPTDEARAQGLRRVAGALSAADLLRVMSRPEATPELRDALLSRLIHYGPRPDMREEDPAAITQGILLLARTRLELKRPDLALAALDALPAAPVGIDAGELRRLRVVALLWTNRITEAAALDAPASAWLDGVEQCTNEPHARAILREIRTRFGPVLSLEESRRLNRLSGRIATPEEPSATSPAEPRPPDHP